ncbi:hypothetical protein DRZ77_02255 [Candidatus Woesearchaeota archaeon]|nr:hypothetical protein [Candidatus Woesearchaeota archaeon]RLE40447.1 MAG: hypothetical protein DRZ77_02255 [Candidatus Woesearchaeota archaeon]
MGQQEVYDFLKQNPAKWFTSKEISKALKVSIGSVTCCLKKLRLQRAIRFKNGNSRNQYLYRYKR